MTGSQWLRALLVVGLIILLTAKLGIWALVVLVGLLVSITLHELGHYLAAKRSGMLVTEFFLGFGPRIWSFRRGETEYGLKLIPAGAYVRIIGMNNLEEVEPEDEARTYRQAKFPDRFLTVVAGVTMNALIAVVLIWVLLAVVGVTGGKVLPGPPQFRGDIEEVLEDSPAARAGLTAGDRISSHRRRQRSPTSTSCAPRSVPAWVRPSRSCSCGTVRRRSSGSRRVATSSADGGHRLRPRHHRGHGPPADRAGEPDRGGAQELRGARPVHRPDRPGPRSLLQPLGPGRLRRPGGERLRRAGGVAGVHADPRHPARRQWWRWWVRRRGPQPAAVAGRPVPDRHRRTERRAAALPLRDAEHHARGDQPDPAAALRRRPHRRSRCTSRSRSAASGCRAATSPTWRSSCP